MSFQMRPRVDSVHSRKILEEFERNSNYDARRPQLPTSEKKGLGIDFTKFKKKIFSYS